MSGLRIRYQTFEFEDMDIHVRTLRDRRQFLDIDGAAEKVGISSATWPMFGVVWASGLVLAKLMIDYQVEGKRILEVGCGIGLASLVLNSRSADISATDHHPEAEAFLLENIKLNNGTQIPFIRTGWQDQDCGFGKFDLIIGSDLLYEPDHAKLLADFIDIHTKAHCEVIIVDPCRGQLGRFSKNMMRVGYTYSKRSHTKLDDKAFPFQGHILRYVR